MPALNFKRQFAQLVESGEKLQSIRALRKDGKDPKPGDTLYLYTGMRTKQCRKLGEGTCYFTEDIYIAEDYRVFLNDRGPYALNTVMGIASSDGFKTVADFFDFFKQTHCLSFYGKIIKWELSNND